MRFICWWVFLLTVRSAVAGPGPTEAGPPPRPNDFFFRNLTTRNGLSYNLVNCLFQDHEGYIWVGTFNGLNRFDGTRFVVFKYDRNDPHSIPHNNILDICEDRNGDLWIATPNGVSRYAKSENRFFNYLLEANTTDPFRHNEAANILCDRRGTVWVTSQSGLYAFDPARNAFRAYRHNPSDPRTISSTSINRNSLAEDPTRPWLWIATTAGINCFDTEKQVFYHYRNNPDQLPVFNRHYTVPLAFDRKGRLVYGEYEDGNPEKGRLMRYSPQNRTLTASEEVVRHNFRNYGALLSTIAADADNNLWVSTWQNMVYLQEGNTGRWRPLRHDDRDPASINSDFFWDLLQARDGTVYVGGMYGLGVYNPAGTFFSVYKPAGLFPELEQRSNFTSMLQDRNGTLWISDDGEGLFGYDLKTGQYSHYKAGATPQEKAAFNGINRMAYIDGEIWMATTQGLHIFNPETRKFRRFPIPAPNEAVNRSSINWCYQDRRKKLWFSVSAEYLMQYDPETKTCRRYNPDSVFIGPTYATNARTMGEDAHGNLWFGTYSGRLYRYDPRQDRITSHIPDPAQRPRVLQQPVNDLYVDPKGMVWLATEGGGLVKYDPARNRFKSWMETDGLLMDVCRSLVADAQGNIWVGTYEGFTVFNPVNEKIENPKIDYGQLENNFYSRGKCLLQNGHLAYVSGNRFIIIDPTRVGHRTQKLQPIISGISVFEKARPLYESIRRIALSYRENFFTLDFSTLKVPQETAVEYSYRLVGYDPGWVLSNGRTFAAYTGVSGGQYRFEVRARYKDGDWSRAAMLPIYIQPPFWEAWWFQLSAVLFALGLIVYAAKSRERRLLEEQQEKSEIRERIATSEMQALRAQMNPHFLYNSLNAIRLFVLQNDVDNAERFLVKFSRLMRLILNNSRQEWVSLSNELELLQLYLELEQLRFDHKFDFRLCTDPALDREKTVIPSMILQPFIENAILHGLAHRTGRGRIEVGIRPDGDQLECTVEDDGVGRRRAAELRSRSLPSHRSVGVQVTEERLQLISRRQGRPAGVEITDKVGPDGEPAGTKVVIRLPLMVQ
ncbi:two-component regulator propeller domain-containing protein [Larkinella soli]|uniref:two-component regulator propeller domain-containing protein n=1 Tax=Larkinella soli TaxID=1770527 RepID=UPI0013E38EA7|nr:two-component regulator propeller domain-containing protein [Larkinella soli]